MSKYIGNHKTLIMQNTVFKNIFVVDDNKLFLTGAKGFLEKKFNTQVNCHETLTSCLGSLDKQPDLVFMDYNLNNKNKSFNGFWAAKKIRKKIKNIPIVMVSNERKASAIARFFKGGITDYIPKSSIVLSEMTDTIMELEVQQKLNEIKKTENKFFLLVVTAFLIIPILAVLFYQLVLQ